MTPGPLFIVSGPSGSGKSTLIHRVVGSHEFPLRLAVSATTRPKRPGERDGIDYHFWSPERFEAEVQAGRFLEHAIVHGQHRYGTPRSEVEGYREKGTGVILDIDVKGAAQVRPLFPDHVSIFIKLPNFEMYRQRLEQRGESPASIARRMETAQHELEQASLYRHHIVNDDLETAVRRLRDVIAGAFARA
jgi:guanylate kinase